MPAAYAELQVTSNFSFLRGASHPEELVIQAAALGLAAVAITDRNTLAGIVRAHVAAKQAGIRLVVGARLDLTDGAPADADTLPSSTPRPDAAKGEEPEPDLSLLCFPTDRAAYGRLSRLLSLGRRRAPKGRCHIRLADVVDHAEGQILVALAPPQPDAKFSTALFRLHQHLQNGVYLAVTKLYCGDDNDRLAGLAALAARHHIPLLATNDVHVHSPARRPLQDVLTCIRTHSTLHSAGFRLFANGERHLKPAAEMARLFACHPDAIAHTLELVERCRFSLDELRYEYPVDPVPAGRTPQQELTGLAWAGANEFYPQGIPERVSAQVEHELQLIDQLGFAPYFLTVHDIVRFARDREILCQGRGSAANSAVCYCLGITAVDPARSDLLFERFVSAARNEPPDIDVDFEHERREEIIQYVYEKYGRERAGMTATVIRYRSRSALREVGKVFGLEDDTITALQGVFWRRSRDEVGEAELRAAGLDPADPGLRRVVDLAGQLWGFPRHLSQHTGGMVITRSPLSDVVPIGNAAMAGRTVIEWDKDDLDALGILKIDILALGMLTCVRKALALVAEHGGPALTFASVPPEDGDVYDMLCAADSVGVFQVESRAQMSMLPRLRPRTFYDLVIEVAIVRPGPIQGDMVHPYLRRRRGEEAVVFPSRELRDVLGKTLGVPLFQEQAMKIAIVAAGFTPSEADGLRRAMATFRRSGAIGGFRDKFLSGMTARGYTADFAGRCFQQIEGFADYGFPESHAASFALIVYVSAWLKCHHPAAFACALLNSQPMGFYAPAQIVGDARRHGVEVRPADVNASSWDCTLEPGEAGLALRLGFRQIKGLSQVDAETIAVVRGAGFRSIPELARRTGLGPAVLQTLADGDGFASLGLDRRRARWAIAGLDVATLPLFAAASGRSDGCSAEPAVALPPAPLGEQVADDYRALRLSLKAHPLALLRPKLAREGYRESRQLLQFAHGRRAKVAGIVVTRQRPGTASGVIFITLEDETGSANLIVWPQTFERFRQTVLQARMIGVDGRLQREGEVIHILAERLLTLDPLLGRLAADVQADAVADAAFDVRSRDFH